MHSLSSADKFETIRQVHDAFDRRQISPLEWTSAFLERAKKSTHGAYITLCEERAMGQAKKAEELLSKSGKVPRSEFPLFGIPLGVKDLITLQGVRTTCASRMLEHYVSPYTATVVTQLEQAGAITLGKLNLDEFGMGGSNENSAFGPVEHPTHPGYVAGGSSGGPAAAVRADLCFAALGTDTGGSIRLPASYCGIVGLKPTYGRISRYGQVAFASSLDQIGPMTQTVEDAAVLLDVMSGHDPLDATSALKPPTRSFAASQLPPSWKELRIGIPKEYFGDGLSPSVRRAVEESIQWFAAQGASLVPVTLPYIPYSVAVYYLLAVGEASSNLARYDGIRFGASAFPKHVPGSQSSPQSLLEFYTQARSLFGPEVKRRIILGTFALSSGNAGEYYQRACQVRALVQRDFSAVFEKVDLLLGPVSPTPAFRIGEKNKNPLQMYLNDIFTIPVNLAGLPAMSVPCGEDPSGLPIGLHMIAPAWEEEKLLSIAQAFTRQWSWHKAG